jgi:DNA-binding MarR family transcriptional regulator
MAAPSPAEEAWRLIWQITQRHKPRLLEFARELDFSPVQLHLLRLLEPGDETPMSALAQQLFCDPSNVTGIVDRLEARGLIERREAERDRRMKVVRLTGEGERIRARVVSSLAVPPPELAALPLAQQRALRDALLEAVEPQKRSSAAAPPTSLSASA